MNPRTTGILLLVAAAIGAFVYLYEIKGGEQRKKAEAESKRLFTDVRADAIQSLSLTTKDGAEAVLERRDKGWALVKPVEFPADTFAADGLASNLADLASDSVLDNPQPPEEYGLGDGANVVHFSTKDHEYTLRLGNKTPVGSHAYASVDGSKAIVTVPSFKAQSFQKALVDLRERRILVFDRNAVSRIEAHWPGGSVQLARVEPAEEKGKKGEKAEDASEETGAHWKLTAPVEGRADDQVVNDLVSDLSFLRANGFVDQPTKEQLAGFDSPDFQVVLYGQTPESGEPPSWRLALGPLYDKGKERLVRGAQASLYTIPAERLADFPRKLVAYRFKQLSKFRLADVGQVDLFFHPAKGDPVAITAERTGDGWKSSPEKLAPGKVARLVSELSNLKAGEIVSEKPSDEQLAKLGLSPPNAILTVFGKAPEAPKGEKGKASEETPPAPRLAEVQIGNVEGSEWIIARAVGDPAVYGLPYDLAEQLPVSLEAFRNRFESAEKSPPAAASSDPADPEGQEDYLPPSEESP